MKWILYAATIVMIVLHQDWWNWSQTDPKWLGFMPVGLWYHGLYCVAAATLLWLFVAFCWPTHLEDAQQQAPAPHESEMNH